MASSQVWLYQSIPAFDHQVYRCVGRFPVERVEALKHYFETHSTLFAGDHFQVLVLGDTETRSLSKHSPNPVNLGIE